MRRGNFLPILVLLVGLMCRWVSAYYFPDGPPSVRQIQTAILMDPEPKQSLLKPVAIPTIVMTPDQTENVNNSSSPDPTFKPEPRNIYGIQQISQQTSTRLRRQTVGCSDRDTHTFVSPGESAFLQSDRYPDEYRNNFRSTRCFRSPKGTKMTVFCDPFNVESSASCSYDYFGLSLSGNPYSIQKFCGQGILKTPTSGNSLIAVFKSDRSNPGEGSRDPYRFNCTVTVSGSPGTPAPPASTPAPGNCECGKRGAESGRIVGGSNAKLNEFPWRCYLKTNRYSFFCGCTILSKNWVLTAAHCTRAIKPLPANDNLYVVAGDYDRSNSTETVIQTIIVDKMIDHPSYDDRTYDNDVSLLKLRTPLNYTDGISPICLPFKYVNETFNNTEVVTSGWGTTASGGSTSNILQQVKLPVLTTEQCAAYFPGQITDRMICTYKPGHDTCQGDSGGSIDWISDDLYYHIGITSWGIGCADVNKPGVYAKTTKFLKWIETMSGDYFCRPN